MNMRTGCAKPLATMLFRHLFIHSSQHLRACCSYRRTCRSGCWISAAETSS